MWNPALPEKAALPKSARPDKDKARKVDRILKLVTREVRGRGFVPGPRHISLPSSLCPLDFGQNAPHCFKKAARQHQGQGREQDDAEQQQALDYDAHDDGHDARADDGAAEDAGHAARKAGRPNFADRAENDHFRVNQRNKPSLIA